MVFFYGLSVFKSDNAVFGRIAGRNQKKCSPASVQSQEATEKVRSSIMPENVYIRWDLVLSGNVQIESDDVWGNHSVLDDITPGFFFAETYASLLKEPLMVNVVSAAAKTEVLFLNIGRLLTTCTNSCTHHNRLIHNLFFISARKNLLLSRRIFHTTPKSIRGAGCSLICLRSLLPQTVLILQFRLTDSSSQTT